MSTVKQKLRALANSSVPLVHLTGRRWTVGSGALLINEHGVGSGTAGCHLLLILWSAGFIELVLGNCATRQRSRKTLARVRRKPLLQLRRRRLAVRPPLPWLAWGVRCVASLGMLQRLCLCKG
jgi:hypothetical protein